VAAEPLAGLDPAAGDPGGDPTPPQHPAAAWVVVALVQVELGGPLARPARLAA
jgi:hypothetical protein